jgi:hypothetical protein
MAMSWATRQVRACTKMYATRISTFSMKSMNPIVGILQSLPATKSSEMNKRSHQDFCSGGSEAPFARETSAQGK